GHEIHLPGFPPTVHADPSRFGTGDDTTDLTQERYYKTIDNLPWALNLPINWKYPIEGSQITHAYMAFAPWAESDGTQYQDWYTMDPDQVNTNLIYNP
ncbi:MAG TPA: LruC domain-containing protein, partial [Candidatus Cloacimonadota bacterium]|nr:LruC domain-containing protein [Candidatus Cloacimonadota bacterium]